MKDLCHGHRCSVPSHTILIHSCHKLCDRLSPYIQLSKRAGKVLGSLALISIAGFGQFLPLCFLHWVTRILINSVLLVRRRICKGLLSDTVAITGCVMIVVMDIRWLHLALDWQERPWSNMTLTTKTCSVVTLAECEMRLCFLPKRPAVAAVASFVVYT